MKYDMVSENTESTVVAEFEAGDYSSAQYQSEAAMEADFIKRLQRQAYEYLPIKCEADLIANLRKKNKKITARPRKYLAVGVKYKYAKTY